MQRLIEIRSEIQAEKAAQQATLAAQNRARAMQALGEAARWSSTVTSAETPARAPVATPATPATPVRTSGVAPEQKAFDFGETSTPLAGPAMDTSTKASSPGIRGFPGSPHQQDARSRSLRAGTSGAGAPALAVSSQEQTLLIPPGGARLSGTIVAIRHAQADQDFYIFSLQPQGTQGPRECITVKGSGVGLQEGMEVDISGEYVEHPKYGRQVDRALVHERLPSSAQGVQRLLERGFVPGIGKELAAALVAKFGARVFEIAQHDPQRLALVQGMGMQRIQSMLNAVQEKRALPRIMSFLADIGLGAQLSHRVYRELGNEAVEKIKSNPYSLAEMPMVGFVRADAVARKLGVTFDSPVRIHAGMEAALKKASDAGSTAMKVSSLKAEVGKLLAIKPQAPSPNTPSPAAGSSDHANGLVQANLAKQAKEPKQANDELQVDQVDQVAKGAQGVQVAQRSLNAVVQRVPEERIAEVLSSGLLSGRRIVSRSLKPQGGRDESDEREGGLSIEDEAYISLGHFARDETRISQHLSRLMRSITAGARSADLSHPRFAKLDPSQLQAVRLALANNVCVITGRPGCGKTTVSKSIIEAFEADGKKIMLVAPTGRAAQRMQEATGRKALTVHRALKSTGEGRFLHDENNPLDADVIFADEASMMDTMLSERFLRAIRSGTRLVMVGDKDQLPSIGPGNVLADIIASECIPVAVLNKPHRTAADSSIITNAHRIINGLEPVNAQPGSRQDFAMIECHDKDLQVKLIVQTHKKLQAVGYKTHDIQVLTPMRKADDPLGSTALNIALKELINPVSRHVAHKTIVKRKPDYAMPFNIGDRVMQMSNNKELGIFNGDTGYLVDIDRISQMMSVRFGEEILQMPFSALDDLDLAYATTVHKSQGSEYKAVITPLSRNHTHMMDRNLLYTAVTRGKSQVVLVGDTYILRKVVSQANSEGRITGLVQELRKILPRVHNSHALELRAAKLQPAADCAALADQMDRIDQTQPALSARAHPLAGASSGAMRMP